MREEQNPLIEFLAFHSRFNGEKKKPNPELEEVVDGFLERLTPAELRVVEVRGFGGHSWKTTSEILGIRPYTAMLAWHRAIEKITGYTHPSLEKKRQKDNKRKLTPAQQLRKNELDRKRYHAKKGREVSG